MENQISGNGEALRDLSDDEKLLHFGTRQEATDFIAANHLRAAAIENAADDFILAPLAPAFNGEPTKAPTKAPKAKKAEPQTKAKGKKRTSEQRNAETAAAIAKGKAKRQQAAADKAAAELAAAQAAKANAPTPEKNMHYSGLAENMPSTAAIESGLTGMNLAQRDLYRAALKGELPNNDPFGPAATHDPFRKHLASLKEEIAKALASGDISPVANWRGGKGTRMTCSSTIPLGRFHQQAILALTAKFAEANAEKAAKEAKAAERKAKREAKKAAQTETATS